MKPSERNFARRIDLTSLQLFVAVCELGSIGKAAEREFIAASAVSKRLSDLEATLGTPLLYRHTRGVDLTPAGESLLHHARSVLFSLDKMQGELSEYADGVRGHVRIHASISAIVQFLPEDLGRFAQEHGEIKIDLEEHLSTEVLRAVQEGAADLGICNTGVKSRAPTGFALPPEGAGSPRGGPSVTRSDELQTLPYREDELVLIVPRGHALAQREAILETATVGVTFLVERRHQWLNRTLARMLGYEPAELLGQETRMHYASDADFEAVGRRAYSEIDLSGHCSSEVQMKRKDGSLLWVQVDGTAITQGPMRGTVWTYVDVTQRRLAEQELSRALARERELGELKSRLLSMASHEFRTPLAAILSSAELIGHYGDRIAPDEQRSIMADLVAAARRMQLMLEDTLTLSQAEAGRLEFQARPVDVEAACRQLLGEVRSAQQGHALKLEVQGIGTRLLDARLLQHILANLATNACKYSPAGSQVLVRIEGDAHSLTLEVTDQGIGIAPADLPRLFDSFHRGGNAGQRPGSGLGRAIAMHCARLHGGQIDVVSKLGAGSTFRATLPAPPAAAPAPPP